MRLTVGVTIALVICWMGQVRAATPEKAAMGSANYQASAEQPVGWRGDGSGRYPAADPPLSWGRTSVAVKNLGAQSTKPKDGEKGKPMSEGVVHDWLTLGPVAIPEGKTAKDDFGTDEGKMAPDANDKAGDLQWKAVKLDNPYLDFWAMYNKVTKDGNGVVAYAYTWIYSPEGMPVYLNAMLTGTTKIWLDGKDLGGFPVSGLQGGIHVLLPLEKGWNRLLMRVTRLDLTDWSKGVVQWHCNAAFFSTEKNECESNNIRWLTPMPDNGPGVGSPIVVGEKVFVTAEAATLVCVSADNGKVLWAKSSTYADAATPEERKASADVFAEVDKLAGEVNDGLKAYCEDPVKFAANGKARDERKEKEKKIHNLMKKVDAGKYPGQTGSEAGDAAPTPVSDGKFVYALYAPGVVACFDMEGNRKWTKVLDIKHPEHGYCASPCLVDGKVIIKVPSVMGAVALDCKTGAQVLSMPVWKGKLSSYSTPLPLVVGGESLIVQSFGVITRAKDGKVLAENLKPPYFMADYASPTFEGRIVCSRILESKEGAVRFGFQTLPETISDPLVMGDTKQCEYDMKGFPCWFTYDHCASPLLYQGLAYCVSVDGVLTVMDAEKGEVVYQKVLDLSPLMRHCGDPIRGGCSSSPTLGGKYIYVWDDQGATVIIEPGRTFKQVARNRIEQLFSRWGYERNECTISNPVFSGKRIYYRGEINLYCISENLK